jgi:hypothetical protein
VTLSDVVLVSADDWEALFIGGFCMEENYSLQARDVIEHLGNLTVGATISYWIDSEWMEEHGSFGIGFKFSDIPLEVLS